MKDRYKITEESGIYFVTSTIVEWIPVFTSQPYFEIIIKSLNYCIENKNLQLYAFVILDNHFHFIISGNDLSNTMASLKKFTAVEIVKLVKEQNKEWLLNQLAFYKKKYKLTSQFQVWQEGFHPEHVQNPEMFLQKLEYIHNNPVKRGYVDLPEQWVYSSARNYINNDHSIIKVDLSLLT